MTAIPHKKFDFYLHTGTCADKVNSRNTYSNSTLAATLNGEFMNFTSSFSSYVLEIYDADDYNGPNPVKVKGMGIINGPENSQYFVVQPDQEMVSGRLNSHFAVRAHYDEDSISHVTDNVTTVSIILLSDDCAIDANHTYNFSDLKHWKVGKISPRM